MADEERDEQVITTEEAPVIEAEVVEEAVEEKPPNGDAEVITDEVVEGEEVTDEAPADEAEATDEAPEEAPAPSEETPITFDAELPVTELIELAKTEIHDKYDVPQPIQAYIETLEAKAQVQPLAEFADYGDVEDVKTLLERQSYITTRREENGLLRPNTDKYVDTLTPEQAGWLHYDLRLRPSEKYQGRNLAQELLIDELGVEGDTVSATMDRFDKFVTAFKNNALPESNIPDFIPQNVREAYSKLSRATRDEIEAWDATDEYDNPKIQAKLQELTLMQKGIEGDRVLEQNKLQTQANYKQVFENQVYETTNTFFNTFRDQFAEDLAKNVQFSTDPKMNKVLAHQQVTTLTQAFDDGLTGKFARNILEEAGIPFDYAKAQGLIKEMELAAANLTTHQLAVDENNEPLDKVSLKKAQNEFISTGKKWQVFAKEILDQEARFASTGKAQELKEAVEKRKVAEKARPAPKGVPTPAQKSKALVNPHPFRTPEYYEWYADKQMQEDARKAKAYAAA